MRKPVNSGQSKFQDLRSAQPQRRDFEHGGQGGLRGGLPIGQKFDPGAMHLASRVRVQLDALEPLESTGSNLLLSELRPAENILKKASNFAEGAHHDTL